jgi:hypothetical protein
MSRLVRNLGAVALAATLAGCATDGTVGYSVGVGYGSPGFGYGFGYDYYDPYYYGGYGTYYGSLMFGNAWYDGPYRYRWGRYGREYWYGNRWRRPDRDGDGEWRDDPPGENVGDNQRPPRPNPGFFRERNAAAARARAEVRDRGVDRPNAVREGAREARGNPWIRGDGGGAAARANAERTAPARPGPGQAAARARAADNDAE